VLTGQPCARFDDLVAGTALRCPPPERVLVAEHADQVRGVLAAVQEATDAGRWAYGAYEIAAGRRHQVRRPRRCRRAARGARAVGDDALGRHRAAQDDEPVHDADLLLFHKTGRRELTEAPPRTSPSGWAAGGGPRRWAAACCPGSSAAGC
jgi:hypothetical protein